MAEKPSPFDVPALKPQVPYLYDPTKQSKYLSGQLQDPQMYSTVRPAFRAIVGTQQGHGVDFIDIQKAIDYVSTLEIGGVIFLRSGTYHPAASITLENSNIYIVGEDQQLTIIDFTASVVSADEACVQFAGHVLNASPGGSIAVTHGSNGVTGTTTTFTDATGGDFLFINSVPYEIASVTDNTHILLANNYNGVSLSGIPYDIIRPVKNIGISNLTIKNGISATNSGHGLSLNYTKNTTVERIIVDKCNSGMDLRYLFDARIVGNTIQNCDNIGMELTNPIYGGLIAENYVFNNVSDGLFSSSGFSNQPLFIRNNIFIGNGGYGIQLRNAKYHVVESNTVSENNSKGIRLAGAQRNIVKANVVVKNASDGIYLEAFVANNSEENIISENMIQQNSGNGIETTAGGNNNIINNNYDSNNAAPQLIDNGTGNIIDNNWA